MDITITDAAVAKLRQILAQKGDGACIRIDIMRAGCG